VTRNVDYREEALLWQSSSCRSSRSSPLPRSVLPPCISSLLVDTNNESPSDACSLRLVSFSELKHSNEVWCVAFSPNGRMIATGSADGKIKLWLASKSFSFSRAVDCSVTANSPLLLRWRADSLAFLCCCQHDHTFYEWNVTSVIEDSNLTSLEFHRAYDQSFDIVYADYFPSALSSEQDLVVSCTSESHIFVSNSENEPLASFVGGDRSVSSAILVTAKPLNASHSKNYNDVAPPGWKTRKQVRQSRDSASIAQNRSPATSTLCDTRSRALLLVANSKNDVVTLFQVVVNTDDGKAVCGVEPFSDIAVGGPVVSLANCFRFDDVLAASPHPLALVVLQGGTILTMYNEDGQDPCKLSVRAGVGSEGNFVLETNVLQSRYVVKPCMSRSGHVMACGGEDGVVRVWDSRGQSSGDGVQQSVLQLTGHCGHVTEVSCWSPFAEGDNQSPALVLASASDDRTVRLWVPDNHDSVKRAEHHISTVGDTVAYQSLFAGETQV